MSPSQTTPDLDTSHVHRLIADHFDRQDGELMVSGVGISDAH